MGPASATLAPTLGTRLAWVGASVALAGPTLRKPDLGASLGTDLVRLTLSVRLDTLARGSLEKVAACGVGGDFLSVGTRYTHSRTARRVEHRCSAPEGVSMEMASLPKYPEQPEQLADVPDVARPEGDPKAYFLTFCFLFGELRANARPVWRLSVLIISAGCYLLAFVLPAASGVSGTYSGVACLLSPMTDGLIVLLFYPSWWANPVYASGLLAFRLKRYGFAFGAGMMSVMLAALYALLESGSSYSQGFYPGFWFWCAAMAVLTVGGLVSLTWSDSDDSKGEATGAARTIAEPVTVPPPANG